MTVRELGSGTCQHYAGRDTSHQMHGDTHRRCQPVGCTWLAWTPEQTSHVSAVEKWYGGVKYLPELRRDREDPWRIWWGPAGS